MKEIISFFALSLLLCACTDAKGKKEVAAKEFRYYQLEGGGGWKSKVNVQKVESTSFQAVLVPLQYYLNRSSTAADKTAADSIYKANERERIVEFVVEDDKKGDMLQEKFTGLGYEESVKYISTDIRKDFYLVTGRKDTIPCSGVLRETAPKGIPYTKILLFFSNVDPNEKVQLVYDDLLYGKGKIKFNFNDPIVNLQ